MRERHPNLIVPIGTQVVTRVEVVPSGGGTSLPKGIVGELIKTPADSTHAYRVRFPDGAESNLRRHEFSLLKLPTISASTISWFRPEGAWCDDIDVYKRQCGHRDTIKGFCLQSAHP